MVREDRVDSNSPRSPGSHGLCRLGVNIYPAVINRASTLRAATGPSRAGAGAGAGSAGDSSSSAPAVCLETLGLHAGDRARPPEDRQGSGPDGDPGQTIYLCGGRSAGPGGREEGGGTDALPPAEPQVRRDRTYVRSRDWVTCSPRRWPNPAGVLRQHTGAPCICSEFVVSLTTDGFYF